MTDFDSYILDEPESVKHILAMVRDMCNVSICTKCPFYGGDRTKNVSHFDELPDCLFYKNEIAYPFEWNIIE